VGELVVQGGDYGGYGVGSYNQAHYANPYCYYPYMSSPLGASMVAPSTQTYQLLPQPPSTAGACHVTISSPYGQEMCYIMTISNQS